MVGGPPQFSWRRAARRIMAAEAENARGEPEKKLASARFKYHQLVFGHYSWFVNEKQCGTAVKEKKNFLHL